MAMFDIGKRASSSSQEQKDEIALRESERPWEKAAAATGTARNRDAAVIGPSIHVEGTLRGEEDLIIQGRVNGTVKLQGHSLTVGPHGQINADIYAHTVIVEGSVEGNLFGAERVVIKKSANIRGNITSPKVSLEEGARFKGAIEMDAQAVEEAMGTKKGKSGTSMTQGSSTATAPATSDTPETAEKAATGKAGGSAA
ncbi:bactofilin family protein [Thioalkalivibrio sulfidiphilus]|uniref:bactofilin family protein n=1 Tax=Thioalkalivibrio sulfidiphilus TaxID=1033854 RepID=UPI00035CBB9D|nr:polymer-forming cytoskeletal protein [Thioalkalivibrio sulfidiphilus]